MNEINNNLEYVKVDTPKVGYVYPTNLEVSPICTYFNGYAKIHVWIDDGLYNAGVEIERRYLHLDDVFFPKINVYDVIPNCIIQRINNLPKI